MLKNFTPKGVLSLHPILALTVPKSDLPQQKPIISCSHNSFQPLINKLSCNNIFFVFNHRLKLADMNSGKKINK